MNKCLHGMPYAMCAICTGTVQARPEGFTGPIDRREKRRFGGYPSTNPRQTTFQITRRVEQSTVDTSKLNKPLRALAKSSIESRYGHMTPEKPDLDAVGRYLRGDFHRLIRGY